ncbi:uncharacterized protein B0H18DRAFT_956156 [Fomitopsis serialis]|uniref:uncharacterized protein n=1 Tax=Fomitopsis serialis TaxID=139415 RepID=UPI002007EAA7|nr:uncharacterized protein B0H18DRAFT_956156 [Neoantrodia serialis]KAH9922620.1 hypothetical protein B0H18DRAFT_956156 [Neoantrodia serialis]
MDQVQQSSSKMMSMHHFASMIQKLASEIEPGKDWQPDAMDTIAHQLSAAASTVKTLRNASVPLHRLPPELLRAIFLAVLTDSPPGLAIDKFEGCHYRVEPKPPIHTLQSLQLVCSLWRNIVRPFPRLWSRIFADENTSYQEIDAFTERSGNTPLDVTFLNADQLGDILCQHMDRVQFLDIASDFDSGLGVQDASYTDFMDQQAPILERFRLMLADDIDTYIPLSFFSGFAPHLTHLSLRRAHPWRTPGLPELAHLYVAGAPEDSDSTSSEAFLNFLDRSPKLEEIILVDAGPESHIVDFPGPSTRRAHLPRLHTVVIRRCHLRTLACVLHHVVPASGVAIEMKSVHETQASIYIEAILKDCAFAAHARSPTDFSIWIQQSGRFTFSCRSDTGSLTFNIMLPPSWALEDIVGALTSSLPHFLQLEAVLRLYVDIGHFSWTSHTARPVRKILHAMRNVQYCTFRVHDKKSLNHGPSFLYRTPESPAPGQLPSIKSLNFVCNKDVPLEWERIQQIAMSRDLHGCWLRELICAEVYGGNQDSDMRPVSRDFGKHDLSDIDASRFQPPDFVHFSYVEEHTYDVPDVRGWNGQIWRNL